MEKPFIFCYTAYLSPHGRRSLSFPDVNVLIMSKFVPTNEKEELSWVKRCGSIITMLVCYWNGIYWGVFFARRRVPLLNILHHILLQFQPPPSFFNLFLWQNKSLSSFNFFVRHVGDYTFNATDPIVLILNCDTSTAYKWTVALLSRLIELNWINTAEVRNLKRSTGLANIKARNCNKLHQLTGFLGFNFHADFDVKSSLSIKNFLFCWSGLFKWWMTVQRISHCPADSVVCFVNTYPLDSGG